jgi:hypothetical protein
LKDQVSLYKHQFLGHTTTWTELEQVSNYLRSQGVADGDVLCFDATTGRLQLQLGLSQPTRYIYASVYLTCFVQHRETIYKELMAGAKRYIVTDSLDPNRYDTKPGAAPIARWVIMSTEYPPNYPDWWPYSEPVVFSSGRYQVHEVSSRMPVQN